MHVLPHFVYRFLALSYSTKKKKMADKILPQRVIIIYRKPFSAICILLIKATYHQLYALLIHQK